MVVQASPLIDPESAALPTDLWGLSRLLLADWSNGVTLSHSYPVAISLARSTGEQRRAHDSKPARSLSTTLCAMRPRDAWLLLNGMKRQGQARSLLPLYCDAAFTTAPVYFQYTDSTGGNSTGGELLSSESVIFNVNGQTGIPFTGTSSGIVVLTKDTDAVTVSVVPPTFDPITHLPTAVGTITYTLPANYIIFRNTTGDLSTTAPSDRVITDGTNTFTIPGGITGSPTGVGLNVIDMESHGFVTQAIATPVSVATITGFGWPGGSGDVHAKFWIIPSGASGADISLPAPAAIFCDTTDRRFQVGARLAIATEANGEDATSLSWFDVGTIASVGDGFITLTTGLSRRYPTGSRVYPLLEAQLILQQSMSGTADEYAQLSLLAKEVEGPSALLPLLADEADTIFSTFEGVPVFDPGSDADGGYDYGQQTEHGFLRDGAAGTSGNATTYELGNARPRNTLGHPLLALSRAKAFDWIRLYDACLGTLRPFVAISPFALFELYDIPDSTHVRVTASGPLSDYADARLLAVVMLGDGPNVAQVRRMTGVTRSGGIDTITLATALDSTDAARVLRVTTAAISRFTGSLTESWQTDEVVSLSLPAIEVFDEDIAIACIYGCDQPPGGGGPPGGGPTPPTPAACDDTYMSFFPATLHVAYAMPGGPGDNVACLCGQGRLNWTIVYGNPQNLFHPGTGTGPFTGWGAAFATNDAPMPAGYNCADPDGTEEGENCWLECLGIDSNTSLPIWKLHKQWVASQIGVGGAATGVSLFRSAADPRGLYRESVSTGSGITLHNYGPEVCGSAPTGITAMLSG